MKRYFLVDFQNVNEGGLNSFQGLKKKDHVEIFYSEEQRIRLHLSQQLLERAHLKLHLLQSACTKNALDFLISCRVGAILEKNEGKRLLIVIVSRDKGYLPLKKLCGKKVQLRLADSLAHGLKGNVSPAQKTTGEEKKGTGKSSNSAHPGKGLPAYALTKEGNAPEAHIRAFQEVYLRKCARLDFGAYTDEVRELILTCGSEKELQRKMSRQFAKGKLYCRMLAEAKI